MNILGSPSKSSYACLLTVIVVFSIPVKAWEVGTHARLTKQSYLRSNLEQSGELLKDLGLRQELDLQEQYFDVSGNEVETRTISEELGSRIVIDRSDDEENNMPTSIEAGEVAFSNERVYQRSPVGWLMRGAIREDDIGFAQVRFRGAPVRIYQGENPLDDPYAPPHIWRVMRHFYDPFNDTGFTFVGWFLGETCMDGFKQATGDVNTAQPDRFTKTPDWALGVHNAFSNQPLEFLDRRNHFTILDAREAMYRALTGMDKNGDTDIGPDNMTDAEIRKAYWSTAFRALGDVSHLIQDMAQPQHTRNDPHSGVPCFGDKSGLEVYTEARAKGRSTFDLNTGGTAVDLSPIDYGQYPIPSFARYSDYFSTAPREMGTATERVASGLGIADYSHRGFFTSGKGIENEDYPLPETDVESYVRDSVTLSLDGNTELSHDVLIGNVTDTLQGIMEPAALVSENVFSDYILDPGFLDTGFSQAPANYRDSANLLLPRAVAYDAGAINHFFRGRLDIGDAGQGIWSMVDHATPHTMSGGLPINNETGKVFGFTKVRMTVRNDTPVIETPDGTTVPQDMTYGFLQAVVKYNLNYCYEPDLKGQFPPDSFDTDGTVPLDDGLTHSGCNGYKVLLDQNQPDPGLNEVEEQVEALERVSVSKRIPVGPGQTIEEVPHTNGHLVEFDFQDDPIPINAREVHLQVLYRGKLGSGDAVEEDAIAVETVDIREPTYWTYVNGTDYLRINGTLMTYDAAISALNNYISQATDDEERDALIDFRDGLTDPSVPMTDFTCKSRFGDVSNFVTAEEIPVKHFVRVALLTNMDGDEPFADNTQMGDCEFVRTRTDGQTVDVTAYYFGHTVKNHTDQFQRDDDVFLFGMFPLFRDTVLKQGGENFYDAFGWGEFMDQRVASDKDRFPETVPADKEQDINDALVPEPVPVELNCNYTWEGCS